MHDAVVFGSGDGLKVQQECSTGLGLGLVVGTFSKVQRMTSEELIVLIEDEVASCGDGFT